ncbi:MAG: hypothetical protein SFW66_04570 [Gammaproteobacteria bacterium]|nr:hypothetical protein [Gammaproteobacteria bacterium]
MLSTHQPHEITTIETFIANVSSSSKLHEQNRENALKVLKCMLWIKYHLDDISDFIDGKKDLYINDRDRKLEVIRDDNLDGNGFGTAIHVTSYLKGTGEQAKKALGHLIAQTEYFLTALSDDEKIIFAKKLNYDGEVGCLEARTADAFKYASGILSGGLPPLDDLIEHCRKTHIEERGESEDTLFDYILEYLKTNKIKRCLYGPKQTEIVPTKKVIADYLRNILIIDVSYEEEEEEKPDEDTYELSPTVIRVEGETTIDIIKNNAGIVRMLGMNPEKIEHDEAWEHTLTQLLDPATHRPSRKVRHEEDKWEAVSGPFIGRQYRGHISNPKKETWKLTKKTATTLLPSNGKMKLFIKGNGLIFSLPILRQLHIEMYSEEKADEKINQYAFPWNRATNKYTKIPKDGCPLQDIIKKNEDAIARNEVLGHNEIVLRLAKEAVVGVIMNVDTPEHRLYAILKRYQLMQAIDLDGKILDLPIIMVSTDCEPREYTRAEQEQDIQNAINRGGKNPLLDKIFHTRKHLSTYPQITEYNITLALKKNDEDYIAWMINQYAYLDKELKQHFINKLIQNNRIENISTLLLSLTNRYNAHHPLEAWETVIKNAHIFPKEWIESMLVQLTVRANNHKFIDIAGDTLSDRLKNEIVLLAIQKKSNDFLSQFMEKHALEWNESYFEAACHANNEEVIIQSVSHAENYFSVHGFQKFSRHLGTIFMCAPFSSNKEILQLLETMINTSTHDLSTAKVNHYAHARNALISRLIFPESFYMDAVEHYEANILEPTLITVNRVLATQINQGGKTNGFMNRHGIWYPVTIIESIHSNQVKIHYQGFDDRLDETIEINPDTGFGPRYIPFDHAELDSIQKNGDHCYRYWMNKHPSKLIGLIMQMLKDQKQEAAFKLLSVMIKEEAVCSQDLMIFLPDMIKLGMDVKCFNLACAHDIDEEKGEAPLLLSDTFLKELQNMPHQAIWEKITQREAHNPQLRKLFDTSTRKMSIHMRFLSEIIYLGGHDDALRFAKAFIDKKLISITDVKPFLPFLFFAGANKEMIELLSPTLEEKECDHFQALSKGNLLNQLICASDDSASQNKEAMQWLRDYVLLPKEYLIALAKSQHWEFLACYLENKNLDNGTLDQLLELLKQSISAKNGNKLNVATMENIVKAFISSAQTNDKVAEISETILELLKAEQHHGLTFPEKRYFFERNPLIISQENIEQHAKIRHDSFIYRSIVQPYLQKNCKFDS